MGGADIRHLRVCGRLIPHTTIVPMPAAASGGGGLLRLSVPVALLLLIDRLAQHDLPIEDVDHHGGGLCL